MYWQVLECEWRKIRAKDGQNSKTNHGFNVLRSNEHSDLTHLESTWSGATCNSNSDSKKKCWRCGLVSTTESSHKLGVANCKRTGSSSKPSKRRSALAHYWQRCRGLHRVSTTTEDCGATLVLVFEARDPVTNAPCRIKLNSCWMLMVWASRGAFDGTEPM